MADLKCFHYILNIHFIIDKIKINVHELIFLFLKYHDDDDDYDYCVGKQRQVNHPPVKQSITNKHYYTYTTLRRIRQIFLHAIMFEQHELAIYHKLIAYYIF